MNYFQAFCREWERRRTGYLADVNRRDCPLCGEAKRGFFCRSQDGYEYGTCDRCGMLYAAEFFPMSFWNDVYHRIPEIAEIERARFLEQSESARLTPADSERFSFFFDRVQALTGSLAGKRYLDVGTFYGAALEVAATYGLEPYGVEGKREIAEYAGERSHRQILHQVSEALAAPVFGGGFDLVSAFEVLEHTPDPMESLRRIHANLADDGLVAISVPNADNVELQLLRENCPHLLGGVIITGHINWFCPETLKMALEQTRFEPIDMFTQYSSSFLNVYLHCAGRGQCIPNYAAIVRGEIQPPALDEEERRAMNAMGSRIAEWEARFDRGPILCAIARKAA